MEQGLDYDKLLLRSDPLVEALKREIDLFHGGDQVRISLFGKSADEVSDRNRHPKRAGFDRSANP